MTRHFQAQAQNTEFVDSMLQLHHESSSSFDLISYIIENTQDSVQSYLVEFNVGAVREISEGPSSVQCLKS